jgi:hypothetical protein
MSEQLLELYKALPLEAQKEAFDFVAYLAEKTENKKRTKKKLGSDFFGAFHRYANLDALKREKDAWAEAVAEKHLGM